MGNLTGGSHKDSVLQYVHILSIFLTNKIELLMSAPLQRNSRTVSQYRSASNAAICSLAC